MKEEGRTSAKKPNVSKRRQSHMGSSVPSEKKKEEVERKIKVAEYAFTRS